MQAQSLTSDFLPTTDTEFLLLQIFEYLCMILYAYMHNVWINFKQVQIFCVYNKDIIFPVSAKSLIFEALGAWIQL